MHEIRGLLKSKELEDTLRREIKNKLRPGDLLLPELRLAEKYHVGRITVRKAIANLTDEGLLRRVRGKGTFVTRPIQTERRLMIEIARDFVKDRETAPAVMPFQLDGEKWGARFDFTRSLVELEENLSMCFATSDADVFFAHEGMVPFLAENELILRLDSEIDRSTTIDKDAFEPKSLRAFSWKGGICGLPLHYSPLVLFYNKDIFDAYGLDYPENTWKWNDMVDAARVMTGENDAFSGRKTFGLGINPANRNVFIAFARQNGGDFFDSDGRCALDGDETMEALEFCANLCCELHVAPALHSGESICSLVEMFRDGHFGMFLGFFNDYLFLNKTMDFRWGVMELPMKKRRASPLSAHGWVISSRCENTRGAFAFLEACYRNLDKEPFINLLSQIPAYPVPDTPPPEPFVASMKYASPTHNSPNWISPMGLYRELATLWMGIEKADTVCRRAVDKFNQTMDGGQ